MILGSKMHAVQLHADMCIPSCYSTVAHDQQLAYGGARQELPFTCQICTRINATPEEQTTKHACSNIAVGYVDAHSWPTVIRKWLKAATVLCTDSW